MKKILTIILDGFGISEDIVGNAVKEADLKNFAELYKEYPHTLLDASGPKVGLMEDEFGNSEVGHTLIGAGREIKQNQTLVTDFLENDYKENENFSKLLEKKDKTFHIMGLCSDGKVHSNIEHILKLYDILVEENITKIYFHLITDGRDTKEKEALKFINMVTEKIKEKKVGFIATICGRYYAMDRDQNFDRTKTYYNLVTKSIGIGSTNIEESINKSYEKGITDEFVKPIVTDVSGKIKDGDILLWVNYRADRSKQIINSLSNVKFDGFPMQIMPNLEVYSFMPIDSKFKNFYFFEKPEINNSLGIYLSDLGLTQARISETEKIAHVSYFFDGGYGGRIENCTKYEIPSPNVSTYDLKPEMSCIEVTRKVIKAMESDLDFILVNFANPDMVGHTGNMEATVKACMAVDLCLGKILEVADDNFYKVVLLADHGNADKMIELDGTPCKTHSMAKVPFIIKDKNIELKNEGTLINVAPTILEYMNIAIPKEMQETESLLK